MGWCDEYGDHEGYVSLLFADGERSSGSSGRGVLVWPGGDIAREEIRPYADVVAWQVQCDGSRERPCDWVGQRFDLAHERPEHIDGRWMEPTEDREEAFRQEWLRHVRPFEVTRKVEAAADGVRRAIDALEDAVTAARADGASWSQIGRAAGVTKQAAQQRWG